MDCRGENEVVNSMEKPVKVLLQGYLIMDFHRNQENHQEKL